MASTVTEPPKRYRSIVEGIRRQLRWRVASIRMACSRSGFFFASEHSRLTRQLGWRMVVIVGVN